MHVYFRNNKLSLSFYLLFISFFSTKFKLIKGYVQTMVDSFCAATKIIPDRASVHTQKWLGRPDFCL